MNTVPRGWLENEGQEPRFLLVAAEGDIDADEGLTKQGLLEMLAAELNYTLVANPPLVAVGAVNAINVGDMVKVTDSGMEYSTYADWANTNGLLFYTAGITYSGTNQIYHRLRQGATYLVVAKAPHRSVPGDGTLLGIYDVALRASFIIGIGGVEVVSERPQELPSYYMNNGDGDYLAVVGAQTIGHINACNQAQADAKAKLLDLEAVAVWCKHVG